MKEQFSRTALILGEDGVDRLLSAKVAVFGVGGVGSFVCEALSRAGVGSLTLIDGDVVAQSNINRQLIALHSTLGKPKTEVMKERILDINPDAKVTAINEFYTKDNENMIDLSQFNYVVDAIDMVTSKLMLIKSCSDLNIPIISAMGAGNKLDGSRFEVADIYSTSVCPLAKVMRRECRALGIKKLKVVYSKEEAIKTGHTTVGSVSFVPSAAGLIIAGEVIKDISLGG
ncbi:MAG: tRNA threonylcarbamoyladenosine dehydratase [Clostridia bacterium]|nr:tRNA threonylcarbamoyladenosine dehydratase [Clostridia bacterium]